MTFDVTYDAGVPDELLHEYARSILSNPANKESIALRICGGDFTKMQQLIERSTHVDFTKLVMSLQRELSDVDKLQSKEAFALEVQDKMGTFNGELWLKAAQFYAKLRGFTDDVAPMTNIQNVIVVPQGASNPDDWSAQAKAYSKQLQAEAKVLDVEQ